MSDYDFSTLNSTDLENLVCDLLNADQPLGSIVKYKTFKNGKDKGIDFLYSSSEQLYNHVGQVKHYFGSGITPLLSTLKNESLKVKKLNPKRYLIATSVDLSVENSESIMEQFKPYIKSLNDIYGKKNLNQLISRHPKVLNTHFKLWFSNTLVFQKLLNSNLEFRSVDFTSHEIKKRLRTYVETPSFEKAKKTLKEEKFLIITGEPGVGKTTLAEMLAYEYIKEDYELIYIYDSIRDADAVLASDESKQLVYFDDFLGSNQVEMNKARGSETTLTKILRRVKNNKNKALIFTTRKHIFNSAIFESERLNRIKITTKETVLHLDEYKSDIRRALLYNHIEASQLPEAYKQLLLSKFLFKFILEHEHFSPRSVEFVTTQEAIGETTLQNFEEFVRKSFNTPSAIWQFAYTHQLEEDDRIFLNTLLSFGNEVPKNKLHAAFDARIEYEIKNNNKSRVMHAFQRAYQRLLGGFIYCSKEDKVKFINPSLLDFLLLYVRQDNVEVEKITLSIIYVDQLTKRLFSLSHSGDKPIMPKNIQHRLINSHSSFLYHDDSDEALIRLSLVIYKYVDLIEKEDVICEILRNIDDWVSLHDDYELGIKFQEFMLEVRANTLINSIIEEKIVYIISELVLSDQDLESAYNTLSELIVKYNIDLSELETVVLENHFNEVLQIYKSEEIEWLREFVTDISEVQDLEEKVKGKVADLNTLGLNIDCNLSDILNENWADIAWSNEIKRLMEKND